MTESPDRRRSASSVPILAGLAAVAVAAAAIFWFGYQQLRHQPTRATLMADPDDAQQVAQGEALYADHCATCHGADLQGQPGWDRPPASGPRPAPPHNETGHTWHHGDAALFALTKFGPAAANDSLEDDGGMPAFEGVLTDAEIWAALAYIKSTWPEALQTRQAAATLTEQSVEAGREAPTGHAPAVDDAPPHDDIEHRAPADTVGDHDHPTTGQGGDAPGQAHEPYPIP